MSAPSGVIGAQVARAPAPSPFSSYNSFLQLAWDNTSVSFFKECPRKYYLAIIAGYVPKHTAPPLEFGALFHSAIEYYDRRRAEGKDHAEALESTVLWALLRTTSYVVAKVAKITGEIIEEREASEPDFVTLAEHGCLPPTELGVVLRLLPRFWTPQDKIRSRITLVRTIVWYCDQFQNDVLTTITLPSGEPAVELSFRVELPFKTQKRLDLVSDETVQSEQYIYCGHLDKVARLGDQNFVVERKHTTQTFSSYYFDQFSPNGQIAGYAASSQIALHIPISGVLIDAAQVGVTFSRFHREFSHRSPAQLSEWLANLQHWISLAEDRAEDARIRASEGRDPMVAYPLNETSCHKWSGCQFRSICSKSPEVRQQFLDTDFARRQWNPLEVRTGE